MEPKSVKAIIIDDEPKCVSNLQYYLQSYCPKIDVVASCSTVAEIAPLITRPVDLAFLDIEFAQDNIFNILSSGKHYPFDIVFVTAYERYALNAFNVDVLDYILKPLRKKDILNCYNKILRRYYHESQNDMHEKAGPSTSRNIVLRQGEKMYVIDHSDIIYLEACGVYTNVCFYHNGKRATVTVSKPISQTETMYTDSKFYRVHRSFVVNTLKVKNIIKTDTATIKMATDDLIPIAKRRVTGFLTFMGR